MQLVTSVYRRISCPSILYRTIYYNKKNKTILRECGIKSKRTLSQMSQSSERFSCHTSLWLELFQIVCSIKNFYKGYGCSSFLFVFYVASKALRPRSYHPMVRDYLYSIGSVPEDLFSSQGRECKQSVLAFPDRCENEVMICFACSAVLCCILCYWLRPRVLRLCPDSESVRPLEGGLCLRLSGTASKTPAEPLVSLDTCQVWLLPHWSVSWRRDVESRSHQSSKQTHTQQLKEASLIHLLHCLRSWDVSTVYIDSHNPHVVPKRHNN